MYQAHAKYVSNTLFIILPSVIKSTGPNFLVRKLRVNIVRPCQIPEASLSTTTLVLGKKHILWRCTKCGWNSVT